MIITAQLMAGELKETWDMDDDRKTLIITKEFQNIRWKMVFKRQWAPLGFTLNPECTGNRVD